MPKIFSQESRLPEYIISIDFGVFSEILYFNMCGCQQNFIILCGASLYEKFYSYFNVCQPQSRLLCTLLKSGVFLRFFVYFIIGIPKHKCCVFYLSAPLPEILEPIFYIFKVGQTAPPKILGRLININCGPRNAIFNIFKAGKHEFLSSHPHPEISNFEIQGFLGFRVQGSISKKTGAQPEMLYFLFLGFCPHAQLLSLFWPSARKFSPKI